MTDKTWRQMVELAEHYKAIGQTTLYLHRDDGDFPWEFVVYGKPWGTHRLDIETSYRFTAEHPCGLTFEFTVELEARNANGSVGYHIDTERLLAVEQVLSEGARAQFRAYLTTCAEKVRARGDEYLSEARRQYGEADTLDRLFVGGAS